MTLLQMTFMAAALIAITIVLRALLLNKLPKQGFMALWYVSLARLLIPFSIPSAASVYTVAQNIAQTSGDVAAYTFSRASAVVIGGFPPQIQNYTLSGTSESMVMTPSFSLPTETIVWLIGAVALALFFVITHLRWLREYKTALPVENDFVDYWQATHPLRRRVKVRCAERIVAPLTYGIFRPVILLPKSTDYNDLEKLSYILSHEYAHIRRFDALVKPLLVIALCLHWFNPLVWAMYILANRDMELICDECAVREYGIEGRGSYALTLIGMEEAKGADPLCNCFKKSAIKERITSIMKIKKTPVIAIIIASVIILSVTVAFATSGKVDDTATTAPINTVAPAILSPADAKKLDTLRPQGYRDMTVAKYRETLQKMTDNKTDMDFLEKLNQNTAFYAERYTDSDASYLFNTLFALARGKQNWKVYEFANTVKKGNTTGDLPYVEYVLRMTIVDENKLTVGEYEDTLSNIMNGMQVYFERNFAAEDDYGVVQKNISELQNKYNTKASLNATIRVYKGAFEVKSPENEANENRVTYMIVNDAFSPAIDEMQTREAENIAKLLQPYLEFGLTYDEKAAARGEAEMYFSGKDVRSLYDTREMLFISNAMNPDLYSADALDLFTEYKGDKLTGLRSATAEEITKLKSDFQNSERGDYLNIQIPTGTDEDYASLLALMTSDYKYKSIEDFNAQVLDWSNADYDRHDRILEDISTEILPKNLSDAEKLFVTRTFAISNYENAKMIESAKLGGKNYDIFTANTLYKEYRDTQNDLALAWCTLYYEFGYDLPDKAKLTVGDRDSRISEFTNDMQRFWDETDIETLLKMSEEDIKKEIIRCAEQNTTPEITIKPELSTVFFEKKDERGLISDKIN